MKRVAADYKDDIRSRLPKPAAAKNGKRIALVGGGPASLTVARDLAPLGYHCVVLDQDPKAGGMIRTQIPRFRLPESIIDEECDYILNLGIEFVGGKRIDSLKALLAEGWDAIFVGSGAPRGRDLDIPGRKEAVANIHIGIDWLSSVSFGHISKIGKRVIVLGGGNTAMDCCRSSRRLGGEDVKVIVRSGFEEMKASPWEKEDAMHEDIPILNFMVPKEFTHENGRLTGVVFEKVKAEYDAKDAASWCQPASPISTSPATTSWSRSARRTPSRGSSATSASSSTSGTCPRSIPRPWPRPIPRCFSAATPRLDRRTSSGRPSCGACSHRGRHPAGGGGRGDRRHRSAKADCSRRRGRPAARTARINLPAPEVLHAALDNDKTYVHSRKTGTLAERRDNLETRARKEAERTLVESARQAGLLKRSGDNAKRTVEALVHSLGYDRSK